MPTQAPDLSEPGRPGDSLPAPAPRDEARLLVQSPRRLFLYWNFARDPRETLRRALGRAAEQFELCARLVDLADDGITQTVAADGASSLWLDAAPRRSYRAEVGFAAEGSPFVRVLASEAVETPPDAASDLLDDSADFQIGARDFAQLLAASGYTRTGFAPADFASAGDNAPALAHASSSFAHAPSSFVHAPSSFALGVPDPSCR